MSPRRDIRLDLEPDTPEALIELAHRLARERPVPSAAFRGELRRNLVAAPVPRSRPARLRLRIAGCAFAGSLLLFAGAVSVAGAGPLAA